MRILQGWIVIESDVAEAVLWEPSWLISVGYRPKPGKTGEVMFYAEYSSRSPDKSRDKNLKYLHSILQVGNHMEDWYLALKDAGFKMIFADRDFEQLMRGQYLAK